MRIHTNLDIETFGQLSVTPKLRGQVYLERFYEYGSRSRARAFDTNLRGLHNLTPDGVKRRRPNSGQRGAGNDWAATYDEWGWFLAALFDADPTARCAGAYDGRADFHRKTNGKYRTRLDINVRISRIVKAYIAAMDEDNLVRIVAIRLAYWRLTEIRREKFPLPRSF